MAIRYRTANIIDLGKGGEIDVLVHGCNCQCTMGAGIALVIADTWPEAREADLRTSKGDRGKLGNYSLARVGNDRGGELAIVNAYTQEYYGRGRMQVDYRAIDAVMRRIARDFAGMRIAMPKIGAGFGGGDWGRIEQIINEAFGVTPVTVVILPS
jgi:O-acetyl-ADP-ribose deacetylase (regulator of RNase III)